MCQNKNINGHNYSCSSPLHRFDLVEYLGEQELFTLKKQKKKQDETDQNKWIKLKNSPKMTKKGRIK